MTEPESAPVTTPELRGESRNPFRAPDFLSWWLASIVAGTGIGIQAVTVPIFIRDRVDLETRALAIAGALVAQTLPGAFLALVGGAVADRVERRRILVRTFSAAALVSVGYVVLSGLELPFVWPVFVLAVIVGAAGAFTNPARHSMLPQVVSKAQLQNGIILGTMGYMATLQFLGPAAGGLITDGAGLTWAFTVEVVLLLAAAILFGRIQTDTPTPSGRNVLGDLVDGLDYVRRQPALAGLLALGAIPGIFFIGPFAVTVPIIVPDVFEASDKWVGLLWGAFGGGVFIGSTLLSIRPMPRRGLAVCLSTIGGGIMLSIYSFTQTLPMALFVLTLWGLNAAVFINFVVALLQENTKDRMMGRVMSMYSLVFFISMPIGYGLAGVLTTRFGIQTTLLASGCAAGVCGLIAVTTLRTVRALR